MSAALGPTRRQAALFPGFPKQRDQAVELIKNNPGITASEIAKTMKIKPNYLYRVLGDLEKQKKVKKKGRTYSAS